MPASMPNIVRKTNKKLKRRESLMRACKTLRQKSETKITDLPSEILIIILSHLNKYDLFLNVRLVSKLFYDLAMARPVWGTMELSPHVSQRLLQTWLVNFGKYVRHFKAEGRTDGDEMFSNISKYCRDLESISAVNIHGTQFTKVVHARPLCTVLTRCKRLANVRLSKCCFFSCKFFKLLLQPDDSRQSRKIVQYRGPISRKQMQTLIEILRLESRITLSGSFL